MSRFNYMKYDEKSQSLQEQLKKDFEKLESTVFHLAEGRAKALVLTKLEEAYMWCGKSIRDSQIARDADSTHLPARSDG